MRTRGGASIASRLRQRSATATCGLRHAMRRSPGESGWWFQARSSLGAVYMPGAQTGSPMTYMLNGRQYIVLGVSGAIMPGELIAYALPSDR